MFGRSFGVLVVLAVLGLSAISLGATYGGGSGTAEDPYQIWTAEQLNTIGANSADWDKHFKLMADIDMSAYTGTQYNIIGNSNTPFKGAFYGSGHVIRNLTYVTDASVYYVGVFGATSYATIRNLGIENVLFSIGGGYVGSIVGQSHYGNIKACYAIGAVSGNDNSGGLVGRNTNCSITSCYAIVSVRGSIFVGGLVGWSSGSSIKTCYAAGTVNGSSYVGGIVGYNSGSIISSFWDIQASGTSDGVGSSDPDPRSVMGLTTADMRLGVTFINAGWDFVDTWTICEGEDYPRLIPSGTYGGGTGTSEDPYQIRTSRQMNTIGQFPGDWNKHFKLMADIDMSSYKGTQYNIIGNSTTPFTGIFNGNGYVIRNLIYETDSSVFYVGMFGYTSNATIHNLDAENISFSTKGNYVGGLVGYNSYGIISFSHTIVSVSGSSAVGGLVGYNSFGNITACYATGSIRCTTDYAGGLVGRNSGVIKDCYATGIVSGTARDVGGLVGKTDSGNVTFCYATASVSGSQVVGGLIGGVSQGIINACYAAGLVSGSSAGGLIGWSYSATITASFWDIEACRQSISAGGTGKNTAEMMTLSTFTNAGWDFADTWLIYEGKDYPRLISAGTYNYGGGTGTSDDPYQIWTSLQMNTVGLISMDWNKHFKLMADIDMSSYRGTQYNIVGNSNKPFTGTFDGRGHVIRNLTYMTDNSTTSVGIFGYASNATIHNLGIENISLSTKGSHVGGLVGTSKSGCITSCYATGSVNGSGVVGGLVGFNYEGAVASCFASVSVSENGGISGGLVGDNNSGSITSCYATGTVSGSENVGGLVGRNYFMGSITACYATGSVCGNKDFGGLAGYNDGAIMACFWNIETSKQTNSAGGKGLTTEQMKTISFFQNANWADKDWVMNDGMDSPRLCWENTGGVRISLPESVPLKGSGTAEDPYLVFTAQEFALLSWYSNILNSHIRLANNLDLSNMTLYPIGDLGPFMGVFDGNGYTLSNLVIYLPNNNCVGIFSTIETEGKILNLGIEGADITGFFTVGGLAGNNRGSITSCYLTGSVSGKGLSIGGLVGENNDGSITSCYVNGTVSGTRQVGGLVGVSNSGSIISSYVTGAVTGAENSIGGLVGVNKLSVITSCHTTGPVKGLSWIGGIAGSNSGTITSCYATGSISGSATVGGLVGSNNSGSIVTCYSTCSISGTRFLGGLVGMNNSGSIMACCSTGNVNGYESLGGLAGSNFGNITSCYATGSVSGEWMYVGGLVGTNEKGTITACYAMGSVSGENYLGGLVGWNYEGSITSCYSIGSVICPSFAVGGLVGISILSSITACFWDTQASGTTNGVGNINPDPSGVIGITQSEMQVLSTFTDAGWDFVGEMDNGVLDYWRMCVDDVDYPRLSWEFGSAGDFVCPNGVGVEDLEALGMKWLTAEGQADYSAACDADNDGRIDMVDFAILAGHWMED